MIWIMKPNRCQRKITLETQSRELRYRSPLYPLPRLRMKAKPTKQKICFGFEVGIINGMW